jgi:hypothetical protein
MPERIPSKSPGVPRIVLFSLFAIYLLTGTLLNVVFPLGEAPDEPAHFLYVRYVAQHRTLPVMQPRYTDNETVEAFQAPAYYVLAALLAHPVTGGEIQLGRNPAFSFGARDAQIPAFFPLPDHSFPWRGPYLAWHIVRFYSLFLGALSLWLTYRTAQLAFRSEWLAMATVAYLSLNPQFIYLHSAVTNDVMAVVAGSLISLTALLLVRASRPRGFALAGGAIALAILSKPSALVMAPGLMLAAGPAWRALPSKRARWLSLVWLGLIPLCCSGWWFLRNLSLYGDLTGISAARQALSMNYYAQPLSLRQLVNILPQMFRQAFRTSWGIFGWLSLPLPQWVFYLVLAVHLGALMGLLLKPRAWLRHRSTAIVLFGTWLGLLVGFLYYNVETNSSGWHGRFLFPGLSVLGLGVVAGWRQWFGRRKAWVAGLIGGCGVMYVISALGVVLPTYLPPRTLPTDASIPNRIEADFGGIELVGYDLHPQKVAPGEQLGATLYWRIVDDNRYYRFTLSGHTPQGEPIVRRTESPLALRYPTTVWPKNRIVIDHVRLLASSDLWQVIGTIQLEVLDGHQGTPIPHIDDAGEPLTERLSLGQAAIGLPTRPAKASGEVQSYFGEKEVALSDYELSDDVVEAGATISVTLRWQALQQPAGNYHAFVHVLDQGNQLVAQHDSPPRTGRYPTWAWSAREVVVDVHPVPIPSEAEGELQLLIGLYRPDTMERLAVQGPDGTHYPDRALPLATVVVKR